MTTIRHGTLLALISLATAFGARTVLAGKEMREKFHRTFPLDNQGKVQLENVR
jgi:hypothetical protein